jgi:hypothetical protein
MIFQRIHAASVVRSCDALIGKSFCSEKQSTKQSLFKCGLTGNENTIKGKQILAYISFNHHVLRDSSF